MLRVVHVTKDEGMRLHLDDFPNAGPRPNVAGMRRIYGKNACLVMCGDYLYNVDGETYEVAKTGTMRYKRVKEE